MLTPVPVPVDPALALTTVHLIVRRAAVDLERVGLGEGLGGSSPVVYRGGTVLPDPRSAWQAQARRRERWLRRVAARPDKAVAALVSPQRTVTLLRTSAANMVSLSKCDPFIHESFWSWIYLNSAYTWNQICLQACLWLLFTWMNDSVNIPFHADRRADKCWRRSFHSNPLCSTSLSHSQLSRFETQECWLDLVAVWPQFANCLPFFHMQSIDWNMFAAGGHTGARPL